LFKPDTSYFDDEDDAEIPETEYLNWHYSQWLDYFEIEGRENFRFDGWALQDGIVILYRNHLSWYVSGWHLDRGFYGEDVSLKRL
jgi:hypothetical protein